MPTRVKGKSLSEALAVEGIHVSISISIDPLLWYFVAPVCMIFQ